MDLDFRPAGTAPALLEAYEALFAACFPDAGHLRSAYLAWLYRENPAGGVVGVDAWDGARLAAHYACVPALARVHGGDCRVLLSLNTATHPAYQGRGLFTRLAEATYDAGARDGHALVYGVANANSTPGFLRKLGFSSAGPLDARVGVGRIDGEAAAHEHEPAFARQWPVADLAWRRANPVRRWKSSRLRDGSLVAWTPTGTAGIAAWSELGTDGPRADDPVAGAGAAPWFRLHLGLRPAGAPRGRGVWTDVPARFRSSPLNLIFRSLRAGTPVPDAGHIRFNAIDFDAF